MLVSIIINNYNYGRYLAEAIESALGQAGNPVELIVVDDGSTDNSRDIIVAFGDQLLPIFKDNGGQASALHLALRLLRPQGTVIDLAFYQAGADEVRLGEEFHHNGLGLRCAQIGRVPRGLAPAWDRERLSAATIDLLRADGDLIRKHLISAVVPFDEAPRLLDDLAGRRRQELQAVLAC